MTDPQPQSNVKPSFFRRVGIAFGSFFRSFSDADYAAQVERVGHGEPPPAERKAAAPTSQAATPAPATALKEASPDAALQLLALLQREARLLDFTMENIAQYSDQEIGAAARVVHEGCRKVLDEHFTIGPVRQESEGSTVTLNEGFDAGAVRLTGNVVGKPPFRGTLAHRGWRVQEVRLPKLSASHDARVLVPAEVEL
jgi:hypothetical protein